MIHQEGIERFLKQPREDYHWIKHASRDMLIESIHEACPAFQPKVALFTHQLASLYLGLCVDQFLYFLDMGLGKEQPLTSKILTPTGWIAMGDVTVGTVLCHPSGGTSTVTHVHPQGNRHVYRVTFSDGSFTECGQHHLWTVIAANGTEHTWPLSELMRRELSKYSIPITAPLRFPYRDFPIDPIPLGNLIGNGDLTTKGQPYIPHAYLFASAEQRRDVLDGIMGCRTPLGYWETTFKPLCDDVVFLIQSLGGTAPVQFVDGKWCIIPQLPTNETAPDRRFRSIEWVGVKPCQCITIDRPDGLYITDDCIVTHNSLLALSLIDCRLKLQHIQSALVVVPNVVNIENWMMEIEAHTTLDAVSLGGTKHQARRALNQPASLYVIHYDGLKPLMTELRAVSKKKKRREIHSSMARQFANRFDMLVLDEIHHTKHTTSLNFKLCSILSKHTKYRIGLTGTPLGRDPIGLWGQFYVIDHGETLGWHKELFLQALFKERSHYFKGVEYYLPEKNAALLHQFLRNRSIRYADHECGDVPKSTTTKVFFNWPPETRAYYVKLLSDALSQSTDDQKQRVNAYSKARQLCSGFVYEGDASLKTTVRFRDMPKLEHVQLTIEQLPLGCKLVIYHLFDESAYQLAALLRKMKVNFVVIGSTGDTDNVTAYRQFRANDQVQVLLLNAMSGGEGLNLQVANYGILYEPVDRPDVYQQLIKRIARTGQTRHCHFYEYVTRKSVEEDILEFLAEGKSLFDALIEGRVSMKRLLHD